MTYVSWGALYEGPTDQVYFEVLIPRLMEDIVLSSGIRTSTIPSAPAVVLTRGTIEQVVAEACEARIPSIFALFTLTLADVILTKLWSIARQLTVVECTLCVIGHLSVVLWLRREKKLRRGYLLMARR